MKISIFNDVGRTADSLDHFMDFYFSLQMRYLASDLLDKGLSPDHISEAVVRASRAGKSSGMDMRTHFMPVFSAINKEIIRDCKLSKMGYGLVLMNADAKIQAVGKWQTKVLEKYFTGN